jgi:hypothetical protein
MRGRLPMRTIIKMLAAATFLLAVWDDLDREPTGTSRTARPCNVFGPYLCE